jgi:hypothetical protein
MESYRREDPPSIPNLAVPVSVPVHIYLAGLQSKHPKMEAAGCLSLIAFFFLLRVGEYTRPKTTTINGTQVSATRTKQFRVRNIGFFKNGRIVPRSSPLSVLLSCDSATMKITNQKNGRMGQTIHQEATGSPECPIRALAHRVHHILSSPGGSKNNYICDYYMESQWFSITSAEIVKLVQAATKQLQLDSQAIDPDMVGSHSLRAGGAMALKLHGYDDTTIMKMGRWSGLTFLQYIHNQIAHLAKDISKKMSIPLPFVNISAIEQDGPNDGDLDDDPELAVLHPGTR